MGADTFDNYIQASEEQKKADFDSVLLALKPNVIIILNHSFASLMMLRSDNSQKSVYSSANYDTVKLKIFRKAINGNNTTYVSFNSDTNDPYFNVDEYQKSYDTLMKFAELMPNEDISQDLERLSNFVKI